MASFKFLFYFVQRKVEFLSEKENSMFMFREVFMFGV